MLYANAFTESVLQLWEYMINVFMHLIVEAPFLYLRQIRQYTYWIIVFNIVPVFLFKNRNHISIFFNSEGKVASNIELLKSWKTKSEKISMLSFIIFTGILLFWQAFSLSRFWISAKILFLVSKTITIFRFSMPLKFLIFSYWDAFRTF